MSSAKGLGDKANTAKDGTACGTGEGASFNQFHVLCHFPCDTEIPGGWRGEGEREREKVGGEKERERGREREREREREGWMDGWMVGWMDGWMDG